MAQGYGNYRTLAGLLSNPIQDNGDKVKNKMRIHTSDEFGGCFLDHQFQEALSAYNKAAKIYNEASDGLDAAIKMHLWAKAVLAQIALYRFMGKF